MTTARRAPWKTVCRRLQTAAGLALLFILAAIPAHATTRTAASCNQPDVQTAVTASANGDTVIMPGPCTPTWTVGVTVPAGIGITIQGTGTPNSTGATMGPSASCNGVAITVNFSVGTNWVFGATPGVTASTLRLSCFAENLTTGTSARAFNVQGTCNSSGCPNVRIDNVSFNNWQNSTQRSGISYGVGAIGDMFGVLDHNAVNGGAVLTATYSQLVEISHASFKGIGLWGDNSWAQPENFGSLQFLFEENNIFSNAGCSENEANAGNNFNSRGGSRLVCRFNQFTQYSNYNFSLGWHGTESSGRPRGGRAFEFYGNSVNYPVVCNPTQSGNCPNFVAVRSGTGLIWGDTVTAVSPNFAGPGLNFLRAFAAINWPACDGTTTTDGNDPSANLASPAFTGKVSAVNGGVITITTMGGGNPGWTTNQWSPAGAPYSLHDSTLSATHYASPVNIGAEINSNTGNTVTLPSFQSFYVSPAVGDTVLITRAFWCMDQSTRGAGALLDSTVSSANPTPAFPATNQALSPTYVWSISFPNQNPGAGNGVNSDTLRIVRNRDYYTENTGQGAQTSATVPFNGTTTIGAGHGTKALRPTTCTTGVSYWATDEGNWNQSGNGFGQGNLYICTATNTWTLSYTPACYPHILVTNGVSACGAGTPSASLSPSSLAFGNVSVGSTSPSQPITLSNPGSALLNINSITLTGTNPTDFGQTNNCGTSVLPGGSCTITVTCTPASAASFSASVGVTDNAAGSPQTASLTCTGVTATGGISFSPTSVAFAGQTVGTSSSPTAVTVNSTGSGNLVITQVVVTGGSAPSFSQTNNCGTVAPAGTCTINVTFSPKAAGAIASTICVTDNAPASPQCFNVSGTGNGVAGIGFNPIGLAFGNQTVGSPSSPLTVTVTDTGTAALTISAVGITGTNSADFLPITSNTCVTTLAVNATCSVGITATPGGTGARSANLNFTDNAAGSPQAVALSATGTQSGTGFSPTSLTYVNQTTSTTSPPQSVTLTNTGTATLNISSIAITGPNLAEFAISAKTCGTTLATSGTCTVGVTFTPSADGTRTANISFTDDAPGSPQTVPLTGTGVATPTNSISIGPSSLSFGSVTVGTHSTTQILTITSNPQNVDSVTFGSIVVSGGNSSDFSVSSGCSSLIPAASCQATVTFNPTATGARASAVVFTDSAVGSPQSVPISGTGAQSGAVVSPATISFGNQPVGTTSAPKSVTLTNNGTATLNISNISLAVADTYFAISANTCGATLAVNASCTVSLTFTPQTAITATFILSFADDAPASPQTVTGSGTGTITALSFNPAAVTFPNTPVSTTSAGIPVVMTNTGNGTMTISSITITGTNASNFAQTNNCGASLAGGGSCTITVKFTPSATGSRTALLTFTDSAPGSPQSVSLQGTGYTPAPVVSLSRSTINFGDQTVGATTNVQVVILQNTGTASLTITSGTIGGTNPGDFGSTTTCGGSLAAGSSCSYSFTFTPTAAGARAATFSLVTNAASSPDTVALSGNGVAGPPTTPAPQMPFGVNTGGPDDAPIYSERGDVDLLRQTVRQAGAAHLGRGGTGAFLLRAFYRSGDGYFRSTRSDFRAGAAERHYGIRAADPQHRRKTQPPRRGDGIRAAHESRFANPRHGVRRGSAGRFDASSGHSRTRSAGAGQGT